MIALPGEPLTERDFEKLAGSYITKELAEQALLRRVLSAEGAAIVGRNGSGNYSGIVIPYIWPGADSVREYRLRRDTPDLERQTDGSLREKAKYLSPPGRGSMLYFVPGTPAEWLQDASLDIALTEGEKKTIALYRLAFHKIKDGQPRFLPIGIPGVWNWRGVIGKTSGPGGERRDVKGPISDLDRIEWAGRKVFIIFDSNVATNREVMRARRALTRDIQRREAKVYHFNIPQ